MKIILIWQSSRSWWWLRKHMPESPPDWWLWQWPARDTLPVLQVMVRKNCIVCSVFNLSLGETKVGVWEHLLSAQPIWLPLFPPGSAHRLSPWHAYELPPVSAPEQTNWFLPRRNLHTTDRAFFQGCTKKPGMSWTRLYPGGPPSHCPPCWAVKPKMPSDPAENHHAGRLLPSPFTT